MSKIMDTKRVGKSKRLLPSSAAIATVSTLVFAIGCGPGGVLPTPTPTPNMDPLEVSYRSWIQAQRDLEATYLAMEHVNIDEMHEFGLYDLLVSFANNGQYQHMSASGAGHRGRPRFSPFDDPDTKIGWDNPDTRYLGAVVHNADGQGIYRMWGNRSNTTDMLLTVFSTAVGAGAGNLIEFGDMKNLAGNPLQLNEDFEVFFSTGALQDPGWDNWVEIPASNLLSLQSRYTACDWATQEPGDIHIEKVGTYGVPSEDGSNAAMIDGIADAIALLQGQGPFIPAITGAYKLTKPVNTLPAWEPTSNIGIPTQWSIQAWFDLEDTEALIMSFPEPLANYYGFEITNFWASSAEWANNQSSLSWGKNGGCQAEESADGMYHLVLSRTDPGVANWVDTTGLSEGNLIARLQGVDSSMVADLQADLDDYNNPQPGYVPNWAPSTQVVNVADVQTTLNGMAGATYTVFNATQRSDQLKVRQDYVRKKYAPW